MLVLLNSKKSRRQAALLDLHRPMRHLLCKWEFRLFSRQMLALAALNKILISHSRPLKDYNSEVCNACIL
jgi:hypothetical protein